MTEVLALLAGFWPIATTGHPGHLTMGHLIDRLHGVRQGLQERRNEDCPLCRALAAPPRSDDKRDQLTEAMRVIAREVLDHADGDRLDALQGFFLFVRVAAIDVFGKVQGKATIQ